MSVATLAFHLSKRNLRVLSFVNSSKNRSLHNNKNSIWLGWEDPLEEGMAAHSSILAWKIPVDRGTWLATVHGVTKSRTQLSNLAQHNIQTFRGNLLLMISLKRKFLDPWK